MKCHVAEDLTILFGYPGDESIGRSDEILKIVRPVDGIPIKEMNLFGDSNAVGHIRIGPKSYVHADTFPHPISPASVRRVGRGRQARPAID